MSIASDTVYCFTAPQARELWRVYTERDMWKEKTDSASGVIAQRDTIILTQEKIIKSYERTIANDSIIRQQDAALYSAIEKKLKRQKLFTRGFQGSTILLLLLLLL
ncbi:MAG: hypothetical protein A2W93_14265 [Bacteroidetes bacterium GWF2_43_63]|nr:MAG: hypothetical protein A2W94_00835 [Bacteroidetes bacterium GWE2_42_42]OFY52505.1 MAG: hypothetical protein A2W93_14265 [Bacteroidetes bacterium GWF2_43_63]HBG71412.1 hypothetical protein [Bacteroidales bacterium]HCB60836.1 hypothetical protein [Bacteroidales bacterium]HCY23439.1 hypothetical protein [Bacteroidales bacterium]